MSLTAKQAAFVDEYLVDLNATQAAIRAGYSERTAEAQGSRLLRNVKVAVAIKTRMADREERTEITQDYVVQTVVDTIERCRQAKPVFDRKGAPVLVETPEGDIVPAYAFEAANVLRGAEILGKHLGMFVDRVEDVTPVKTEGELIEQARRLGIDPASVGLTGGKAEG